MLVLNPARSAPATCCSSSCTHVHFYFPSHLFFGGVVAGTQLAAAVALDTSWDLPMDCLSCGGGYAWGRWGLGTHVARRPVSVLIPTGSAP
jgi:hypothetical protein